MTTSNFINSCGPAGQRRAVKRGCKNLKKAKILPAFGNFLQARAKAGVSVLISASATVPLTIGAGTITAIGLPLSAISAPVKPKFSKEVLKNVGIANASCLLSPVIGFTSGIATVCPELTSAMRTDYLQRTYFKLVKKSFAVKLQDKMMSEEEQKEIMNGRVFDMKKCKLVHAGP